MIERALRKRWGEEGAERAKLITESFPDVNPEAVARAILSYKGNFPPYPKDIDVKVHQLDIDGVWMKAIQRSGGWTREEHLKKIRQRLKEDLM